ncbi:hypothetical protein BT63DRAFT_456412 [Microthyrium microscopicum]|uniref:Uncharacterized protein n=1 Tax=Microthyrium microscopicum TaxID=703497 RepID=A0A6A6UAZ9_9PEZI|nr:hypothetical protein BT63DRAFT_456412 [Microthyrium microscopicum]
MMKPGAEDVLRVEDLGKYIPLQSWQNIFVNEKGKVVAFIDCDELDVLAAAMGYVAPPIFLYANWVCGYYHFVDSLTILESSIKEMKANPKRLNVFLFQQEGVSEQDLRHARLSHVLAAIWAVLKNEFATGGLEWLIMKTLSQFLLLSSTNEEKCLEILQTQESVLTVVNAWMEFESL